MAASLTPEDVARSHRWHAVECNNLAWELSVQASRSPAQDEEMRNAAHAAAFHWDKVGTDLNRARASLLLGQVYAALGLGEAALVYAKRSYEDLVAHDPPDWEMAFAKAILAHAACAAHDPLSHEEFYAEASALGEAIADPEDKAIFFKTFNRIPRPREPGV